VSRNKVEKGLARLAFISDFYAWEYTLNNETGELAYLPSFKIGGKPFPRFPVLIQGNGEPWTLGNLHLTQTLMTKGRYRHQYNSKTWSNYGEALLQFLRWLEATGTDPLDFHPIHAEYRPTYRFRAHLEMQIRIKRASGNQRGIGLSASTASETHGVVQAFYRTLTYKGVLTPERLNLAWKDITKLVKIIGYDLANQSKLLAVKSTDQAVRREKKKQDHNRVEGGLRPLTKDEQEVIDKYLAKAPITTRLMFTVARLTGARLQTVCTLRGSSLKEAVYQPEENNYLLHVGGSRLGLCNTKGNKEEILVFSAELHDLLTRYWNGNLATSRRILSPYGNTLDNYLFLNQNNTSFYASHQEKDDCRDPKYHSGVSPTSAMKSSVDTRKGQAIQTFIKSTLLPRIQMSEPGFENFEFRFHDLRATFGMNTLKFLIDEEGMTGSEALEKVCELMNHSNLGVTTTYLDFRNHKGKKHTAENQLLVETRLLQNVPDDVLNYDCD
jgi:hypothetical protein